MFKKITIGLLAILITSCATAAPSAPDTSGNLPPRGEFVFESQSAEDMCISQHETQRPMTMTCLNACRIDIDKAWCTNFVIIDEE